MGEPPGSNQFYGVIRNSVVAWAVERIAQEIEDRIAGHPSEYRVRMVLAILRRLLL